MNLNILNELNWLCTHTFFSLEYISELLNSINIDYNPQQKFISFLHELNGNKENFSFEYVSDHVNNLFEILESEGVEIQNLQIKNIKSYSKKAPISEEFIEFKFIKNKFYSSLIQDFNEIYRNGIFWVLPFILRKILENYLIDILRKKYGMKNIDLFYKTIQGRFEDFCQLLSNFEAKLGDFKPYSAEINKKFINKLNSFREKGNSSAHNIEVLVKKKYIDENREEINHIINLLESLLNKIS